MNELRLLDIFSGIGGMSVAAINCGFTPVGFSEVDPYCCQELARNFPGVRNYGAIEGLTRERFAGKIPFVVAGGVPCQPASLIGERRGTDDDRWLWPEAIRIMREFRPWFGLFENPPALLNLERGTAFNGILSGLAALRYDVWWDVLPAYAVGAGHRRERLWILASNANSPRLQGYAWHVAGADAVGGRPGRHVPGFAADENLPALARPGRSIATPDLLARKLDGPQWYHQSGIQLVVDGLPGRLVKQQLHAIGNSLVPACAEIFLGAIAKSLT